MAKMGAKQKSFPARNPPGTALPDDVAEMLAGDVAKTGDTLGEAAAAFMKICRSTSIIPHAATVVEVANLVQYTGCKDVARSADGERD